MFANTHTHTHIHTYTHTRTHGSPDQHRLSDELVVHRNERVVGRKGPRGAFSMDEQLTRSAVDHVLLDLGDVVRDVVHHLHMCQRPAEKLTSDILSAKTGFSD